MKKFILQSVKFIVIICVYFYVNYRINKIIIRKNPPKFAARNLIMGDSHVMTALDPSQFINTINFAQEGEPYAMTFFKLKEITKYNTIDTLILGFSPQNISIINDFKFNERSKSDAIFSRIIPITKLNDFRLFEINKFSYIRGFTKNYLLFPRKSRFNYLGRFKNLNHKLNTKTQKPNEAINRHFYFEGKELSISSLSIAYLDSILKIASKNRIYPILVNTPVHPIYHALIPMEIHKQFEKHKSKLKEEGISIYDYSNEAFPDDLFADFDHTNNKGALIFSHRLKSDLKKHSVN